LLIAKNPSVDAVFASPLPWLYQIPEPGGNHTKSFPDSRAFYAFRFMFRLLLGANDRENRERFHPVVADDQGAFQ
jgi:hypothetical protein